MHGPDLHGQPAGLRRRARLDRPARRGRLARRRRAHRGRRCAPGSRPPASCPASPTCACSARSASSSSTAPSTSPPRRARPSSAGVWLRPFRDLVYTMPPYVTGDEDLARIAARDGRRGRGRGAAAMRALVVAGTDTGVGKTVVTAALAARARARGERWRSSSPRRPASGRGEPGDLDEVRRLCRRRATCTSSRASPSRSRPRPRRGAPARPACRAARGRRARARASSDRDLVLVEGAGGLLVRFDDEGGTLADVAAALGAPVLVVARAGLGTLNATRARPARRCAPAASTCAGRRDRRVAGRARPGRALQPRRPAGLRRRPGARAAARGRRRARAARAFAGDGDGAGSSSWRYAT